MFKAEIINTRNLSLVPKERIECVWSCRILLERFRVPRGQPCLDLRDRSRPQEETMLVSRTIIRVGSPPDLDHPGRFAAVAYPDRLRHDLSAARGAFG
jgi:hypothetical protein